MSAFRFIAEAEGKPSISLLCEMLGVSRSGFQRQFVANSHESRHVGACTAARLDRHRGLVSSYSASVR